MVPRVAVSVLGVLDVWNSEYWSIPLHTKKTQKMFSNFRWRSSGYKMANLPKFPHVKCLGRGNLGGFAIL